MHQTSSSLENQHLALGAVSVKPCLAVHLHFLWRPQTRDPADEMVLKTALNGRADALITLNAADFGAAERFRLTVLTPGAFLRRLEEQS
jgi:predicted nucleic acid-binding protein